MNRQEAIALFGSAASLADALGYTSRHAVYMWAKDKPIPERAYLKIRYELRPECFGQDGELLPDICPPDDKQTEAK